MSSQLQSQTAIVTGGARGIGAAIALRFAQEGANVVFTYAGSTQKAQDLVREMEALGVQALAVQSNVVDQNACEKVVEETLAKFGRIDICVNNAGISKDGLLPRVSPEQWAEVISVNLTGVYNMTRQVVRPMMKQRAGSIINMSSIAGIRGNVGQSTYAASKAGVIGFTKSVAIEFAGRGVRCNAVAPGFIETDMTAYLKDGVQGAQYMDKIPLKRYGAAQEIAAACVFLASSESSYITGQVLSVCGGLNI